MGPLHAFRIQPRPSTVPSMWQVLKKDLQNKNLKEVDVHTYTHEPRSFFQPPFGPW